MLKPTFCPKCGKPWNPATDDMVQLFNHSILHTWLEKPAGQRGSVTFSIREFIPVDQRHQYIAAWIKSETEDIEARTKLLTPHAQVDSIDT